MKKIKWFKIILAALVLIFTISMFNNESQIISLGTDQLEFLSDIGMEIYYGFQWLGELVIIFIIWLGVITYERNKVYSGK